MTYTNAYVQSIISYTIQRIYKYFLFIGDDTTKQRKIGKEKQVIKLF